MRYVYIYYITKAKFAIVGEKVTCTSVDSCYNLLFFIHSQ